MLYPKVNSPSHGIFSSVGKLEIQTFPTKLDSMELMLQEEDSFHVSANIHLPGTHHHRWDLVFVSRRVFLLVLESREGFINSQQTP